MDLTGLNPLPPPEPRPEKSTAPERVNTKAETCILAK